MVDREAREWGGLLQLHACTHKGGPLREHSEVVARLQLLVHVPLHKKHQPHLYLRPVCDSPSTDMFQFGATVDAVY